MGKRKRNDSIRGLPKNWPTDIVYLTTPFYTPQLTAEQLRQIRTRPEPGSQGGEDLPEIPASLPPGPSPLVEITPITDPAHPARGQSGLFAARDLRPGRLILPYLGEYHPGTGPGAVAHAASDYDLWLDRGADVAVDAARRGNEARFVNDYRGTGRQRANAEFRGVWDGRRGGEEGMGVFVLPLGKRRAARLARGRQEGGEEERGGGEKRGKKGAGGDDMAAAAERKVDDGWIRKGEEIVVSYGKGFWEKRREEEEGEEKGQDGEE